MLFVKTLFLLKMLSLFWKVLRLFSSSIQILHSFYFVIKFAINCKHLLTFFCYLLLPFGKYLNQELI
jgi:hypothetical protein